jgi:acyl-ACP thioesterase
MKVEWCGTVGYMDIDPAFRMRPGALARVLQEAAVTHSERVGIRNRDLVRNGAAWVLHKMAFDVARWPTFGEDIRVLTWHRGGRGFKAFRDFEIWTGDERLVAAATLWLFIDLARKRPRRFPSEWAQTYTVEDDQALAVDLDAWQPPPADETVTTPVTLRSSDFDPLGHVNNTAYFDFLETGLKRWDDNGRGLAGLRIQFCREIGSRVDAVRVSLAARSPGAAFRIHDARHTFVRGEVDWS